MTRWWTSDLHFGHEYIIQNSGRPFAGARGGRDMNNALVDRWNDAIVDEDEVWILGDLVAAHLTLCLLDHVRRLKGRKILVPGDHDRCWRGHTKFRATAADRRQYRNVGGIDRIVHDPKSVVLAGEEVRINHFPYLLDAEHDVKFADHCPQDDGGWLLHGHILEKWRQNGRQINVGVDAWDFTPVSDMTICEMVMSGPARIDCPTYAHSAAASGA